MLKTFINPDLFTAKPSAPVWINLLPRILRDLNNVKEYYRNVEKRVNNDHVMVKAIKILRIPVEVELTLYQRTIEEKAFTALNRLDFTTFNNRGTFIYEAIHANTLDYIKVSNFEYNIFSLEQNWKDVVPLKVLGHNFQDVTMNHPDNNDSIGEVFYEIDPVLMLLQYKYWALERLKYGFSTDPAVYVYTYLLTNSIESFLNLSIINISLTEVPTINFNYNHKFHMMDLTLQYKQASSYISKKFRDNRNSTKIETLLNSVLVVTGTALNFLKINDYSTRTNIKWFYYLYNIDLIEKIIVIESGKGNSMNKATINKLMSDIKKDLRTATIKSMVPGNIDKMKELLKLLKGM